MKLFYESSGDGPAIVLAHGVGGNHASWFQQVPVFAKAFRVVAFDHRGFGRSPDEEGSGRAGFIDDLKELLDELDIEHACLMGQSMGGGTVTLFAERYPERVRALVLADSLFGIELPEELRARFNDARADAETLSQPERVLGPELRRDHPDKVQLYSSIASFNDTHRRTLRGSWGALCSPERLGALGFPILFVVGEHDVLVPPALVRDVAAIVPGSFVVEISGAGHSAYFEKPTEFNDSVLSFLHAVGIRGGGTKDALSNTSGYTRVET